MMEKTGYHFADLPKVFVVNGVPFGFADFLNHDLFGRLGSDSFRNFARRHGDVVAIGGNLACLTIYMNNDVRRLCIVLSCRDDKSLLNPDKYNLPVDFPFEMNLFNNP